MTTRTPLTDAILKQALAALFIGLGLYGLSIPMLIDITLAPASALGLWCNAQGMFISLVGGTFVLVAGAFWGMISIPTAHIESYIRRRLG